MEHGISDSLLELLTRQDMRRQAVGAASLHGMKSAGVSDGRDDPQVLANAVGGDPAPAYGLTQGVEHQPIRIAWNNPSMRRAARSTASLMIVCKQ